MQKINDDRNAFKMNAVENNNCRRTSRTKKDKQNWPSAIDTHACKTAVVKRKNGKINELREITSAEWVSIESKCEPSSSNDSIFLLFFDGQLLTRGSNFYRDSFKLFALRVCPSSFALMTKQICKLNDESRFDKNRENKITDNSLFRCHFFRCILAIWLWLLLITLKSHEKIRMHTRACTQTHRRHCMRYAWISKERKSG